MADLPTGDGPTLRPVADPAMNRLAGERSPYLLQHATNPVDWYPWGDEAFSRARQQALPIFLSIGYSTCHWCHVMAHESFGDTGIADLLNRHFVSIKVDREERPDVDRVYMAFVQATTGSGGWPMTVFLTPELRPFYGGTYFPPTSRWGRPGFADLLQELARVWTADRARVDSAAAELFSRLQLVTRTGGSQDLDVADVTAIGVAVAQYQAVFDARQGGFGAAPKFPRPSELLFLLRAAALGGDTTPGQPGPPPLQMATETLRAMALGGMRDHLGGGFHRYSVDAEWRVPHFEKMLYDQAQLVLAYLEAAQATGDRFFADVAEDTLAYVRRDLTDNAGGFYSAEDADSVPAEAGTGAHKMEGAFYIWSDSEIAALGDDADLVRRHFGIEAAGNAPQDPQGEFAGKNLLYLAESVHDIAARTGRNAADVAASLERARATMCAARAARPRPHVDDKVLTAWNGLMIAAFARASRVLPDSPACAEYLAAAERAASFIRSTLWTSGARRLQRRYRQGAAGIAAYAEDYAFLIFGLIELFQAGGDVQWLEWALTLQQVQDERFWDPQEGGWFSTDGEDATVLLRLKEDSDGAEPSAGAVSVLNLIALTHLVPDESGQARARRALARLGPKIGNAARALPMMLSALAAWHAGPTQIVVVGAPADVATRALRQSLARRYLPYALVIPVSPGPAQERTAARLELVRGMTGHDAAAAYLCHGFTCQPPVTTPERLAALLDATGQLAAFGSRD